MNKIDTINPDRVSMGIDGLDFILKGGLTKNRLYLLQGNPGTGKTTIGLQFLLDGEQKGETGLYITLSESKEELIAVGKSHGWDLEKLNIFDLTISGDTLRDDSRYTVFHPSEVELDETTKAILERGRTHQPDAHRVRFAFGNADAGKRTASFSPADTRSETIF